MNPSAPLPRRTFLRGLGASLALPALEAMLPFRARATTPESTLPRRMAFVFIPNGVHMPDWTPQIEGANFDLPPTLEPLAPHQSELLVLSGLAQDKARPNGDGAGDHARASATFLTAAQARKTDGADIHVGVSVDQVAAARVGQRTRFASLELGCDRGKFSGNCDSGYSCAYSFNIAWKTPSTPMPPEVDPRRLFERLFSSGNPNEDAATRARRRAQRKSILDFVLEDTRRLQRRLGYTDRRKLDEYLTAVRELEQRIDRSDAFARELPEVSRPTGIPASYAAHIRLMFDLLALAFQTDTTRIATFILAHDGSNRPYPWIGVPEGHHTLSHHGNDPEKQAKIARINHFHLEQLAYFLGKLRSVKEGEGTLLDHSMIVYGSAISDGNRHNHDELPILLAGRAGGALRPGRHLRYPRNTPMANLFLEMLDRLDVKQTRFGDSTGRLPHLT